MDAARHLDANTEVQRRTDWYIMPSHRHSGIKLREGKLEIKLLNNHHGLRDMSPLVGSFESWTKWSLDCPAEELPGDQQLAEVGWLAVQKTRYLQRYEVDAGGILPSPTRPVNGCEFEFEWTELLVNDQRSWTVGFEAVGRAEQREQNLRQVAAHICRRGGLLTSFDAEHSFGYAEWLSRKG
jgi:hypothetical protein